MLVDLERPSMRRVEEFVTAVRRSRTLHRNLVTPPATVEKYRKYLRYSRRENQEHFFVVVRSSGDLAGVINISDVVRGYFQCAYLGYYSFTPNSGKGYMWAGLRRAINHAFRRLKLHRLEANIQPDNERSIRLVRGLGFRLEGLSPEYLKISGRWRDHERWALLADEWRPGDIMARNSA
jgi:ribosomal-protein-alanine N-acetyltransferase